MNGNSQTPQPRRGRSGNPADRENRRGEDSQTPSHRASPANLSQIRLQGSARIIKDHCADWNNFMERWDELNDKGFQLANKIINLKLHQEKQVQSTEALLAHDSGAESEKTKDEICYPEGLEDLCNKFADVYTSLKHLAEKMHNITVHFEGVRRLEYHTSIDEDPEPLFDTWTVDRFCEISEELEGMYSQEIKLKESIVQDIAHQMSRDVLMTYISLWHHQPYLEERNHLMLKSMLLETGWVDP
ncbi:cyclin-dependent kinase 2-interacting protein-like isoform X2 [Apostichopus japonicus]|uniref:cyclin-dependent kinase 2-interacting protein-like isoform X2 n=1 Tax=Stichopus japonicus TaxID=307972 RepID=UPI003AB2C7B5